MATVTILQLPQAVGLTGNEQIEGVQNNTSVRLPVNAIAALLGPGPAGPAGPVGPEGPAGPALTTPIDLATEITGVLPVANGGASEYNIKSFGALADSASHPLSSVFPSLAAAQIVFPKALDLNEEINLNAVRRCIDLATTAGGGRVRVPAGSARYRMVNSNAASQITLQFPQCSLTGGSGTQVDLVGDGSAASELWWPNDWGTKGSNFALSCGDPNSSFAVPGTGRYTSSTWYGWVRNIGLIGPNLNITKGTVNANLSGFAWGARRFMEEVHIQGFYANMDIVGDWTSFKDCIFENGFYNVYFPHVSSFLYGDLIFTKCSLGNAARAGICIGTRGYMGAIWSGCYIGTAPYMLLNEAGTQGTTPDSSTHVASVVWTKCLFENIGNGLIYDDNANTNAGGTGTRNFRLERMCFDECYVSYNSGQKDTTQSRDANWAIVCTSLKAVCVRNFMGFVPGDLGIFQIDALLGWEHYADLTAIFSALQGGKQFADAAVGVNGITTFRWKDANTSDRGSIWRTSSTVTQYDVMETNNTNRAVQSTNSTLPVLGTAKHSTGTANTYLMVCFGGHRPIVNSQETPPSANTWIKKGSTAGKAMAATGPADGQIIGYSTSVDTINNRYNFEWASGAVVAE